MNRILFLSIFLLATPNPLVSASTNHILNQNIAFEPIHCVYFHDVTTGKASFSYARRWVWSGKCPIIHPLSSHRIKGLLSKTSPKYLNDEKHSIQMEDTHDCRIRIKIIPYSVQ